MSYPEKLPIGTLYPSRFFGKKKRTRFVSTLTYRWGTPPRPFYIVPILSGLVSEWVPAETIVK